MIDNITDRLKKHFDFVDNNTNYPDKIVNKYFGISDIWTYISEINEGIFRDRFLKIKIERKFTIFEFEDFYDFINTYLKIDTNDLYIYFRDNEIMFEVFVVQFLKKMNQILKIWVSQRASGFRKDSRLYLDFKDHSGVIKLIYEHDLRV